MQICVVDNVVGEINRTVGTRRPESGGALLGPKNANMVSRFVFDVDAETTMASYVPSRRLQQQVQELETSNPSLVLKGILHSHPGGMNRPSSTDLVSFNDYLSANPHLAGLWAVIGTFGGKGLAGHEIQTGPLRLSFFLTTRGATAAAIRPSRPRLLPVGNLHDKLRDAGFALGTPSEITTDEVGMLSAEVYRDSEPVALVTLSESFPAAPPTGYWIRGDATEPMNVSWNVLSHSEERLQSLVEQINRASAASPSDSSLPRTAPDTQGVKPTAPRVSLAPEAAKLVLKAISDVVRKPARSDLFARSDGILDRRIARTRALILGCGSVGSTVALQLARAGIQNFTLIDPDRVEAANVGRSTYFATDIGAAKVQALGFQLKLVNRDVRLRLKNQALQDLDSAALEYLVSTSDIVVGAADDPKAQASLAHSAYQVETPGVFLGMYARAAGGEIIASVPEHACYNCAIRSRLDTVQGGEGPRSVDYDTGRLEAEPGLYADIATLSDFAAKMALSLTPNLPRNSVLRNTIQTEIQRRGRTFVLIGLQPNFMFFDDQAALGSAPAQLAFQSMWLSVTKLPECSTCGDVRGSIGRLEVAPAEDLAHYLLGGRPE